jgi:excisionase family DNA binding protein
MHPHQYAKLKAAKGVRPTGTEPPICTGEAILGPSCSSRGPPVDPRAFGFLKAAYTVHETIDLLSIGRTSLYAAVKRGDLKPVKFGKKTLFYAVDLAEFLTKLQETSS